MSVDLTTRYLGLDLANPIVPSASPLTAELDNLKRLESVGAPAVVLPSLFEEQIVHEEQEMQDLAEFGAESFGEATFGYFPEMQDYNTGPRSYLKLIEGAANALTIPVIASLNGATTGGWTSYAKKMEDAGATALELNIYIVPADPTETTASVEQRYLDLIAEIRAGCSLPLAVKIGPYFTAVGNMVRRIGEAGANGVVMFNRYLMPDIDLDALAVKPTLNLSTPPELRLPLRWIALLRDQVDLSLALSSGVHSAADAVKGILAGADVTMVTSALLQRGPDYLKSMLDAFTAWFDEREYDSVEQAKGSMSREAAPDPDEYERSNYMQALISFTGPAV